MEDDYSPCLPFNEIEGKSLKAFELSTLRRHHCKEVSYLANIIGNDLEKVDFIELDDLLGIDEKKLINMSLIKITTLVYEKQQLGEEVEAS